MSRRRPSGGPRAAVRGPTRNAPGPRPGERFEGDVRDLASNGRGVVRHPAGRVFFVAGVWPGEKGVFETVRLRGRSGEARLLTLLVASPARRMAPCPYHGFSEQHCGGCAWMFVAYAAQLAAKQARVDAAVAGLADGATVQPIWPSEKSLAYRNRAQFKSDGRQLGYQAAGSHALVDVEQCAVLDEVNQALLSGLRRTLPNDAWRPRRRGEWVTLHIDEDAGLDEITPDQRRPFRQGNPAQNLRMRDWLRERVMSLAPELPAVELFAGSGNFTEVLIDAGCTPITAVDSFEPAVASLQERAPGAVQAACLALDRRESLDHLGAALAGARLLVLDPPREGFPLLADTIGRAPALETVIYVSCDVATWARDVGQALAAGFRLEEVQPLDLFPQTPHVEVLSLLRRA